MDGKEQSKGQRSWTALKLLHTPLPLPEAGDTTSTPNGVLSIGKLNGPWRAIQVPGEIQGNSIRLSMSKPSQVIELWQNKERCRQIWGGKIGAEGFGASCVNPAGTKGILTFPGSCSRDLSSGSSKTKAEKKLDSKNEGWVILTVY